MTSDKLLRIYLAHKWGMNSNLPTSHIYKNHPRTVAGQEWNPGLEIQESLWTDKSNNRNHARPRGTPSITPNAQNNLGLMTYSGTSGEYHEWEKISDIKTVFWVVRKNGTDSDPFLLGDLNDYNFHSLGSNYLHTTDMPAQPTPVSSVKMEP